VSNEGGVVGKLIKEVLSNVKTINLIHHL